MRARLVLHTAMALAFAAAAGAAGYKAPRTPAGQPDLEGIWSSNSLTRLERIAGYPSLVITEAQARAMPPPHLLPPDPVGNVDSEWYDPGLTLARLGSEIRTSWIVDPPDGKLPYSAAGRALLDAPQSFDGPEARPNNERCLTGAANGPPMLNGIYNNNWQILQTGDDVAILMEHNHEVRIVRLGERQRRPAALMPWMGDSVGWFEGDTLVIETTNFAPGQSMRKVPSAALYLSSTAVVTERLTRVSRDQILYEFTVRDPAVFTRTWRAQIPLTATSGRIFEYACHEGNYSLPGILAGARRIENEAKSASAGGKP